MIQRLSEPGPPYLKEKVSDLDLDAGSILVSGRKIKDLTEGSFRASGLSSIQARPILPPGGKVRESF
jgi:hypothetical protein